MSADQAQPPIKPGDTVFAFKGTLLGEGGGIEGSWELNERARGIDIIEAVLSSLVTAKDVVRPYIAPMILEEAGKRKAENRLETVGERQDFAKWINGWVSYLGLVILHPDSGDTCIVLAISDKYGGKFVLENRTTRKRSRTSKEIEGLLPLRFGTVENFENRKR
jgi:hypothetical protein